MCIFIKVRKDEEQLCNETEFKIYWKKYEDRRMDDSINNVW